MIESDAEKLARTAADLARKSAEFQVLQRVSSDINSTLELDEIYDVALRTMGELFEFHHATILLLVRDDLIGVFSIESPVRRAFSEHERALVSIVANQIAGAIHNARLYQDRRRSAEELQALNASLEARVAERTAALERELRVAQELVSDARSRVDGPLLGESALVRAPRDDVARQAAHVEPLFLTGAPGVGKEAV